MFRVSIAPIIRNTLEETAAPGTGHDIWATTILQRGLIWPRWRMVVTLIL
jgi:hypothetical protein